MLARARCAIPGRVGHGTQQALRANPARVFQQAWNGQRLRPSAIRVSGFHASPVFGKGLMPDTAEPVPPDNEVVGEPGDSVTAAPLSDEQFDARATSYLELLEVRVGDALAKGARIELEHGADALNITRPGIGNFALVKHPEAKQLFFSSPATEKRAFTWGLRGGGMNQKQDTDHGNLDGQVDGKGDWIDLEDGSNLSAVLEDELQISMGEKGG